MPEFIAVETESVRARLGARPVSFAEYRAFLHATGRHALPAISRGPAHEAVVYVSQADALTYLLWLGENESGDYRLPAMAELLALAEPAGPIGTSLELWPHSHGDRPEVQGAHGAIYLCEWTREQETPPVYGGGEPRVLGSVFYPPWLRQGNNPKQVQGMMLATQGYSFVSFRPAVNSG